MPFTRKHKHLCVCVCVCVCVCEGSSAQQRSGETCKKPPTWEEQGRTLAAGRRPLGKEPLHFTAEVSGLSSLFCVLTIKCVRLNFRYKKIIHNDQSSLETNDLIKKEKECKILVINKK